MMINYITLDFPQNGQEYIFYTLHLCFMLAKFLGIHEADILFDF